MQTLREFADWFLMSRRGGWFTMPHGPIVNLGNVIEIVLYRRPPFQATMYVFPEKNRFPEHQHPNMEQIIVPLAGNIDFIVEDESRWTPEQRAQWMAGEVRHTDVVHLDGQRHAGNVLSPACFLSLEKWTGPITTASVAWDGEPASEQQRKLIEG